MSHPFTGSCLDCDRTVKRPLIVCFDCLETRQVLAKKPGQVVNLGRHRAERSLLTRPEAEHYGVSIAEKMLPEQKRVTAIYSDQLENMRNPAWIYLYRKKTKRLARRERRRSLFWKVVSWTIPATFFFWYGTVHCVEQSI